MAVRRMQSVSPERVLVTETASPGKETYHTYYTQLTTKMSLLESAITSMLRKQEQEFMSVYRSHMFTVHKELKEIRKKSEETDLEVKQSRELMKVRTMMEWFRDEALALREKVVMYRKEKEDWKQRAVGLEAELQAFMKSQVSPRKQTREIGTDCTDLPTVPIPDAPTLPDHSDTTKYAESIRHLQRVLDAERRKTRSLLTSQKEASNNDLAFLFLEAVKEVRRQVKRRRAQSAMRSNKPVTPTLTPADKAQVLELLVSKEEVLELLYSRLFPMAPTPPRGFPGAYMHRGRFTERSTEL